MHSILDAPIVTRAIQNLSDNHIKESSMDAASFAKGDELVQRESNTEYHQVAIVSTGKFVMNDTKGNSGVA